MFENIRLTIATETTTATEKLPPPDHYIFNKNSSTSATETTRATETTARTQRLYSSKAIA